VSAVGRWDWAPTHTGIGRCTGIGARPAPVIRSKVPLNVTVGSVHSRRSKAQGAPEN
jgi:hypothetical protein